MQVDAPWMTFYSSRHSTGSNDWRNLFDLGNSEETMLDGEIETARDGPDFYDDAETFNAYMSRRGRPESHRIWERQRLGLRQPPKAGSSDLSAQESLRIDRGVDVRW